MTASESLAPVRYRFPLARPLFDIPPANANDDANGIAPTPFGLRFFRHVGDVADMTPIPYRYSPDLQVAVCDDDTNTRWVAVHTGTELTTTGFSDGKDPRGEEFKIDGSFDHR